MKINYFFLSLSLFLLLSCSKVKVADYDSNVDLTAVSYSKNVQPLLEANCVQCHSAGNEGIELYDYDHVANAAASGKLAGCLSGNTAHLAMPINTTLNSIQQTTFVNWIEQGFQDN